MWEEDLKTLIKMNPEHISANTLTVEKGTDLFSLVNNNEISMPGQNQEGDWFLRTHDLLSNNGYQAYEVSNFSKFGYECKHNLHYWNIEPYLAFGPSAHGFDGYNRWNNTRSINQYLDRINSGESPVSKNERLKLRDYLNELITSTENNVTVQSGIRVHDLNTKLLAKGYALENTGAIAMQSVAGATQNDSLAA